jgi:transcriptional regulator with XRE-family HTH domain
MTVTDRDTDAAAEAAYAQARRYLALYRRNHAMIQEELAERMGVTQGEVSRLEAGERGTNIGMVTLYRWAAALGLRPRITFDETDSA